MMRIGERLQLGVLPVNRAGILRQIIRSEREEIHFGSKLIGAECRRRCLDHNADLNFIAVFLSLVLKLSLAFR